MQLSRKMKRQKPSAQNHTKAHIHERPVAEGLPKLTIVFEGTRSATAQLTIPFFKLSDTNYVFHCPKTGCNSISRSASCSSLAPPGIPRVSFHDGTVALGVPIGSNAFIAKDMDDVCGKLVQLARRIGLLTVCQCEVSSVAGMLWRLSHQPSAALFAF